MNKFHFLIRVSALLFLLTGIFQKPLLHAQTGSRSTTVLFFSPEIDPKVEEITDVTNISFFSETTDRFSNSPNFRMVKTETVNSYHQPDSAVITEFCANNDAQFAVIPKVKFFKVGIGRYVLSSQVVVSMKLYDSNGSFISEHHYDTFRKNARILGSAENSIKLGTKGALKDLIKSLRRHR